MHLKLTLESCSFILATLIIFPCVAIADSSAPNSIEIVPRVAASRHSPVQPFDVGFDIENSSDKLLTIEDLSVGYPIELLNAGLLPKIPPPFESACGKIKPSQLYPLSAHLGQDLGAGKTLSCDMTVPLSAPHFSLGELRWLFVSSGEYSFRVVVSYKSDQGQGQRTQQLPVSFNAPFSALILGAFFGAFLIGILRTWTALLRTYRAGHLTPAAAIEQVGAFIGLQLPVSLLIAFVAIILANISTEFRGVLRLELNDFWAGMLVGMLAQSTTGPIADALGRVLGDRVSGETNEGDRREGEQAPADNSANSPAHGGAKQGEISASRPGSH